MTPPRANKRPANQALTPLQEIELWAWHKAKKALGTSKTKAREFNVSLDVVESSIARMQRRERL